MPNADEHDAAYASLVFNALVYWPKRRVKEMTRSLARMLETDVMPTVLVLFDSEDQRADRLAEFVAQGARRVRFTEVDVRVAGDETSADAKRRRLESPEALEQ